MKRAIFGSLALPFYLVPQNYSYVVERLGKFVSVAGPGLHFKVPLVEYVGYKYSLKEQVCPINSQSAITKDNVMINIDGVLYYKITDAVKASYQIANPVDALTYMAQTSMRSEIGRIDLDTTFKERARLNASIKLALNHASSKWGIECMRYEIKDIKPPEEIKRAMELQAEHERLKRSMILQSEGSMTSVINVAEGERQSSVLKGEGEAMRIRQEARGVVESLKLIGSALEDPTTEYAMRLKLCENYLKVLTDILDNTNVVMLPPGHKTDLLNTLAATMALYKNYVVGGQPSNSQISELHKQAEGKLKAIREAAMKEARAAGTKTVSKKDPLDSDDEEGSK